VLCLNLLNLKKKLKAKVYIYFNLDMHLYEINMDKSKHISHSTLKQSDAEIGNRWKPRWA